MFCTGCGQPAGPADLYCARCGRRLAAADTLGTSVGQFVSPPPAGPPIDRRLRLIAGGAALAAAASIVIALFPSYSYTGTDAVRRTLHDSPGTLAYNLVFITALLTAALLTAVGKTARFGLGMVTGSGFLFMALLSGDVGDILRGGADYTSAYNAPGAGFYWGLAGGILGAAAATVAAAALRRSQDLSLAPSRTSALWAVAGMVLAGAWILGTWWPWTQNIVTLNDVNGSPKTVEFDRCCSLSNTAWQWVAQAVAVAVLLAAIGVVAACLRSAAVEAGLLLAGAVFSAAQVVDLLLHKPYTLEQVAAAYHVSKSSLVTSGALVRLEVLPGAWIATAASAGFVLMAVGRGIQAGTAVQPSVPGPPAVTTVPTQSPTLDAPAQQVSGDIEH
jgi:hypothetical protein